MIPVGGLSSICGTVASLHIHPSKSGEPLLAAKQISLQADRGIVEDRRYFGRTRWRTGKPSRRQVSLIEREQIAEHAEALGLETIPPGAVRSNIETTGIDLLALVGQEVNIGGAVMRFYEPRTPCAKMDVLCQGLRELMENNRQGVMAEVVRSGVVRVGDRIHLVNRSA